MWCETQWENALHIDRGFGMSLTRKGTRSNTLAKMWSLKQACYIPTLRDASLTCKCEAVTVACCNDTSRVGKYKTNHKKEK